MDSLDSAQTYELEYDGVTYKFKRPTSRQSMQIDVLAANYRGNVPINALTYAAGLSDCVATLNVMCISPETRVNGKSKGFDFGDMPSIDLYQIYMKVQEWVQSFRPKMELGEDTVGEE